MAKRNTWRARFNEWELSQIDAAAPSSLIGRMASMLDEMEAGRSEDKQPPAKLFLERGVKSDG